MAGSGSSIFTAYFDASGDKKSSVLTMAAFVSRRAKWQRFETEWRALLPPDVTMFHMTDFVSSRKGWEDWKGDSTRREALVAQLVACIKRNTNKGFATSLLVQHYDDANRTFQLIEKVHPYALMGIACLGRLRMWADRKRVDWRKIRCIFEDGDEGQGNLMAHAQKEGFDVVLEKKASIRAFDSCDLAAWRSSRLVERAHVKKLAPQDRAEALRCIGYLDQLDRFVQDNGVLPGEWLKSACGKFDFQSRTTQKGN